MEESDRIRLNRFLAQSGLCSRRSAEKLIKNGRVLVNGRECRDLSARVDPERDTVAVDGEELRPPRVHTYIALHKPRGYVTTMSDELGRRCVRDLVRDAGERVFPVGRLDKESEGLLLFTNDGLLAHMLMHPRFGLRKVYRVTLDRPLAESGLEKLEAGIMLEDGIARAQSARFVTRDRKKVELAILEGKKREVRRMFEALGLEVLSLIRTDFGPVRLGRLPPGKWRKLTEREVILVQEAVGKSSVSP